MKTLLLVLLLALAAAAETPLYKVTFETTPPGADVILDLSGTQRYQRLLGKSGEPLWLDLGRQEGSSSVTLIFHREGFRDKRERVGTYYFQGHDRYPESGTVVLEPTSWVVAARTLAETHPQPFALVGLMGSAAGVWAWRRRRSVQAALHRATLLEGFLARADASDPHLGKVIAGYRLVELLGSGGMAWVYRAVPERTLNAREAVAIKVFRPEVTQDELFYDRFRREATLSGELRHRSIVCVLGWGEQEGLYYLIQELVVGRSLRGALPLPLPAARECLVRLLEGLHFAHERGIIHRDVKPDNLMMATDGAFKIMDFGLARDVVSPITKTGTALGTPAYMAPEQIGGNPDLDGRCDQYAAGVTAFELLTGRTPFVEEEMMAMLLAHTCTPPPRLTELRPDLPEALSDVIARMLAKSPGDRFADLREARLALEAAF